MSEETVPAPKKQTNRQPKPKRETTRATVDLTERESAVLRMLAERADVGSNSALIRHLLNYVAELSDHCKQGGKIVLRKSDGSEATAMHVPLMNLFRPDAPEKA